MKIRVREMDYNQVLEQKPCVHRPPHKPNILFRSIIRAASGFGLMGTGFTYETEGFEKLGKEPCLILMNHSCFLDLMIVSRIFYPRPYCIVCTSDGFVGQEWLMRQVGCIPTRKFVTDVSLVRDMEYALKTLGSSVLMYPEASYSFDGTATPLPRKMGVLLKKLDVPVVMIETFGAFSRNPLYNELKVRKSVPVSARARCLFTREEIRNSSVKQLSDALDRAFTFDHFRWQKEQKLEIRDDFRADGLSRILYKCASCHTEGQMEGKGTTLACRHCGKTYTLTPLGELEAAEGKTEYSHIPDWYTWERSEVRNQLLRGDYRLDIDVKIAMMVNYDSIYMVGQGHLTHDRDGFTLTGCDGRLHYTQKPQSCYGLYADYYWYEIGDVICIGNQDALYYCFPQNCGDVVARTRLAAEELYKLFKERKLQNPLLKTAESC